MRQTVKIIHRYHFTSTLKRMSVIASVHSADSSSGSHIVSVKGAPETLRGMFVKVPSFYDALHKELSCNGGRIMALGHKDLGSEISPREIRDMTREEAETNLVFDGFIVLSCPLKKDSEATIKEIQHASHHTIMITGDNPLTACHVAKSLNMSEKELLILSKDNIHEDDSTEIVESDRWIWRTVDEEFCYECVDSKRLTDDYRFCLSGEALLHLQSSTALLALLRDILIYCRVFARVNPKQKEWIIHEFKEKGFTTLMCGDGTNDVGALKHAHVGVALLPGTPEKMESIKEKRKKKKDIDNPSEEKKSNMLSASGSKPLSRAAKMRAVNRGEVAPQKSALEQQQAKLRDMLEEMDKEQAQIVKLGDASIASPFTSRYCTPNSICHVIKQGRCTLVTTLQMFKILALNALILAYSQSVLYLDGIKFSDGQATLQGILLAGCFLFISRSKPLTTLSKERPLPNIFNVYTILTVMAQFAVHFTSLIFLVREAYTLSPKTEEAVDWEKKFEPGLVNSVVYIVSMSMQVSTFVVNYRGRPFMESLTENKPLFYSTVISLTALFTLLMGLLPDLSKQFDIVEFPAEFQMMFCQVLIADFTMAWVVDRLLRFLFGSAILKVR